MGLLDDAIRDHLELKRRRGADPAEVERAEREALGPVRRQPEAADDLEYADQHAADGPVEVGDDPDLYRDDPGHYDQESGAYEDDFEDQDRHEPALGAVAHDAVRTPDEIEPFAAPAGADPAPANPVSPPTEAADRTRGAEPDPGIDTKPHETVRPDRPAGGEVSGQGGGPVGEQTAEYNVEADDAAGGEREDVLEETPEFLQDTPDHDRLWFEQRPPRDFNFDG